jgi:hypothetical protein
MAAEAGQQISHAVLQTVLQQEENWQHTHWLLTLDYTRTIRAAIAMADSARWSAAPHPCRRWQMKLHGPRAWACRTGIC